MRNATRQKKKILNIVFQSNSNYITIKKWMEEPGMYINECLTS